MNVTQLTFLYMGSLDLCSVEEHVQGDNLEVCADFDSEHWEDTYYYSYY